MPIAFRKYGEKFSKDSRKQVNEGFKEVQKYIREEMEPAIIGRAMQLADEIFHKNGKFNKKRWEQIKRSWLNTKIPKPVHDFDRWIEKLYYRKMKDAFYSSRKMLLDDIKNVYPIKKKNIGMDIDKIAKKFDFKKPSIKIKKRLRHEAFSILCEDDFGNIVELPLALPYEKVEMEDGVVSILEEEALLKQSEYIYEQTSGEISIPVGSGKLNKEFQSFLKAQFNNALDPSTRIVTYSSQHVTQLKNIFMEDIAKGVDPTFTKRRFVNKIMGDVTDRKLRKRLEYSAMRILRTSYGRSAAASTSMFCQRNSHIFKQLERMADGRPCFLEDQEIITNEGKKGIKDIEINDKVLTHKNRYKKVVDIFIDPREDILYTIETDKGKFSVTEDHEVLVLRNSKRKWIKAKDLKIGDELIDVKM